MMYDVVYKKSKYSLLPNYAIDEVIKTVNKICNEGHKGKKGWRPQGGVTTFTLDGDFYATQAVVNYEEEDNNKNSDIDVRML